jgi:small subunit ribosomal protein S2
MLTIPVKDLLEAGVHFGTRASRWNPKMKPFIFARRNLIHIIDLKETLRGLIKATTFLQRLTAEGHQVLFVGTKRQAQTVIAECARKVNMPYVSERWLGGTLTNFETVRKRLSRLNELEEAEKNVATLGLSKKAVAALVRERRKIFRNLDGIRMMERLPGALVIIDPKKERNAVKEAAKLGVPVVAVLDTDCDPTQVDIPIPGNDDSMRSIQLLMNRLTDSITVGLTAYAQWQAEEEKRRAEDDKRRAEEDKRQRELNLKKKAERDAQLKKEQEKEALIKAAAAKHRATGKPEGAPAKPEGGAGDEGTPPQVATGETKPGPAGPEPVEAK